jgi:histidinol-phosphate aminotransferase
MKVLDIEKLARKNILSMQSYSSAREEFENHDDHMIFMDANENPYENGLNRYPDPKQRKLKTEFSIQKSIPEKNIILGNGSDELLDLIIRSFCEPYIDSVITLPPTYGMYNVLANLNAVSNKEIMLNPSFQPDTKKIFNAVDSTTKIIFLCSPNNPTGNSFSEKDITEIIENFKGLVLIDEAYIDFSTKKSWLHKIQKYPNLMVLQTLSKAHALAGLRLGILYANEQIILVLNKIKPPYNINQLTQKAALEQILQPAKTRFEVIHILKNRKFLENHLAKISFVRKIFPSDANFILVKVDDAEKRYEQLIQHGVVIRNRSSQELCENCLRITVGTTTENRRLIEVLNKL